MAKAGKHGAGAKRGKTCSCCQGQENVSSVPKAGKRVIGAKGRKTCHRCQGRENVSSVPTVLKHATGAKPVETSTSFPGLFPFELGRREKTLASAGHVPILHPKILGVIN